ncbi:MAG: hypothetical protein [Caudoviricetes sp.]|jgi:hypothetical protein|nr:MAG: hypothetical protein [Caudoviricetes sp.]QHJ82301.1 MAG: hypothetical protein [Caudoviricetes sp.]
MADIVEITPEQQLKLDVLNLFNNDPAAAGEALDFIGVSRLNFKLVVDQLPNAQAEQTPVARAVKAVSLAKSALTLFQSV